MAKQTNSNIQKRIKVIKVLIILCFVLLCAKVVDIQVFKAEELSAKASRDYARAVVVKGERGQIFDQDMNKLCTNIDAVTITACPAIIDNPELSAKKIAPILGIKRKKLKKLFSSDKMFAWVAQRVPPEQAKKVRQLRLPGIYFEQDYIRSYPNRTLAGQVIGFTGTDQTGLEGLEFKYNNILEGQSKKVHLTLDGKGRVFDYEKKSDPKLNGKSIVLTIDKKIQFFSEQVLKQAVIQHEAKSGMVLVMRPGTGELLALAHFPEFNPNDYRNYNRYAYRNRAITDAFEPGSAMKIFTVAAAIESGIKPETLIFCEEGSYKIGRYTVNDVKPHEWLSMNQVIQVSSNIGVVKLTEIFGDKVLYDYLVQFGFNNETGIGLNGETTGILHPYKKWSRIDSAAISFGQGVSVSALQLITAVSAVANEGKLMKPILVKKILSNTGEVISEFHPQPARRVISQKTAKQIKNMMNLVTEEDGTGKKAAIEGYNVCGKTGTAQKVSADTKGYAKNKYLSTFTGFAPLENPELSILVVIDEPQKQHFGGTVAAPVFKSIMAEAFAYLNIPPEKNNTLVSLVSDGGNK
jgi:cell division protein FtsI (penicillin-binding protein 3)